MVLFSSSSRLSSVAVSSSGRHCSGGMSEGTVKGDDENDVGNNYNNNSGTNEITPADNSVLTSTTTTTRSSRDDTDCKGSGLSASGSGGTRHGLGLVAVYEYLRSYSCLIRDLWKDVFKMLPSLYMVAALCFHFFGYECARAASITMLAAKEVGLGTQGLSYTVMVGSPASAAVLYFYARSFKRNGALFTQRVSSILCILMLVYMVVMCNRLNSLAGRVTVVCFYAFREIYVSLLSTQQWSFIASHLDKSQTSYLVTFAGIVSVSSAIGGCLVEYLVSVGGVRCLLVTSLVCLIVSYSQVEIAHVLSGNSFGVNGIIDSLVKQLMLKLNIIDEAEHASDDRNRQDGITTPLAAPIAAPAGLGLAKVSPTPTDGKEVDGTNGNSGKQGSGKPQQRRQSTTSSSSSSNVWKDAYNLFSKYQTLRLLLAEAVIHQFSSNMLNLMFHDGLRLSLVDDSRRAVVVGRFFAVVNVMSCVIQCLVLPVLLSSQSLPYLMCSIPMLVTLISFSAYLFPCLLTTMFAFGTLKVLEYSIMTSANEMIYMPMTTEVRSIGKELIRFFGQRLGKSAASLSLSALSAHFCPSLASQSLWSACITLGWGLVMYPLASHLAERERAIETTAEKRKDSFSHTRGDREVASSNSSHDEGALVGDSTAINKSFRESGLRNRRSSGSAKQRLSIAGGGESSPTYVEEKSDTTNESDELYSSKSSSHDEVDDGLQEEEEEEEEEEEDTNVFDDMGSNGSSGCSTPNLEAIHLNWNVAAATMDGLPMAALRRRRAYTEGASDLIKTPKNPRSKAGSRIVHSTPRQKSNSEKSLDALCLDRHADLTIKMPVLMLRIDSQLLSLDQLSSSAYAQPAPMPPPLNQQPANPYVAFAQSLQEKNGKKVN